MRQGSTSRALHHLRRGLRAAALALTVAATGTVALPAAAAAREATTPTWTSASVAKPANPAKPKARRDTRPSRKKAGAVLSRRSKGAATRAASRRTASGTRRAGDVLRRTPATRAPRLLAARSREPELGEVPTVVLPDLSALLGGPSSDSASGVTFAVAQAAPAAAHGGAFTEIGRSASALLDRMISRARSQLGTRYVLGGNQPGASLDCSSFARYAMEALGIALPRTAAQQARVGKAIPRDRDALKPGDLLTFGTRRTVDHVGIYLGEGRFIHASVKSGRVIETTIERNGQLFRKWQGARRLIASDDDGSNPGG
ncbi:C40 family peptidase [Roseisolibacter sp. H3M3-2]|uniref:C40 family peptidase n=1 Tax=Roseisolibacter sp. H3M3-2 TaxID=3031323 RepID=UPI0023DB871E|nr:C40 family peptidase [Roseisolibacter sp. H3M3-2]MDF1502621.1 NlpC/P60 family protein [Roseisolibacter sp. H3M3-2]